MGVTNQSVTASLTASLVFPVSRCSLAAAWKFHIESVKSVYRILVRLLYKRVSLPFTFSSRSTERTQTTMMSSSSCRQWMLIVVWLVVMSACLGGHVVDTELNLTGNEDIDVGDEFQDLFVDRRSLNLYQSSSSEGKIYRCELYFIHECRVLVGLYSLVIR